MKYLDNELATVSLENLESLLLANYKYDQLRCVIRAACNFRNGHVDYISTSTLMTALEAADPVFFGILQAEAKMQMEEETDGE